MFLKQIFFPRFVENFVIKSFNVQASPTYLGQKFVGQTIKSTELQKVFLEANQISKIDTYLLTYF